MTHVRKSLRHAFVIPALVLAAMAGPVHAQFQDRTIRFGMTGSKEHPAAVALAKGAECVASKSGGKMKLRIFHDSSLGPAAAMVSQLRSGTLDGAQVVTSDLAGIIPQMAIFDLPFLFNDAKEADALLDGPFGTRLSTLFPAAGLVNLAYIENGFRHMTNSRKAVNRTEDLQGLKIRVIPNKVFLDIFTQLGTNPVPMAFSEVYSALETKAIDGQENPIAIVHAMKLYEVQKHMALTRHVYSPGTILYSKTLFDKLSPEEQAAMRECSMDARLMNRELGRSLEVKSLDFLKAQGMNITTLAPEEIERLREKTKGVYTTQGAAIGSDLMTMLAAELKRIRGN